MWLDFLPFSPFSFAVVPLLSMHPISYVSQCDRQEVPETTCIYSRSATSVKALGAPV